MPVVEGAVITIPYEAADEITVQNLNEALTTFKDDLKKEKPMIFVNEPGPDKKLIRKHIKALKLILDFYG